MNIHNYLNQIKKFEFQQARNLSNPLFKTIDQNKLFKFNQNGEAKLSQILSLKNEEPKKKYIKLELYEKDKIYSNLILIMKYNMLMNNFEYYLLIELSF